MVYQKDTTSKRIITSMTSTKIVMTPTTSMKRWSNSGRCLLIGKSMKKLNYTIRLLKVMDMLKAIMDMKRNFTEKERKYIMNIMITTNIRPMKPIKLELNLTITKVITIIMVIIKMESNTKPERHTNMKNHMATMTTM